MLYSYFQLILHRRKGWLAGHRKTRANFTRLLPLCAPDAGIMTLAGRFQSIFTVFDKKFHCHCQFIFWRQLFDRFFLCTKPKADILHYWQPYGNDIWSSFDFTSIMSIHITLWSLQRFISLLLLHHFSLWPRLFCFASFFFLCGYMKI